MAGIMMGRPVVTLAARRAFAHPVLPLVVLVTILLTATSLATLLAYSSAAPARGLAQLLSSRPTLTLVHVDAAMGKAGPTGRDQLVRTAVAHRLDAVLGSGDRGGAGGGAGGAAGVRVDLAGESAPYRLPPRLGQGALTSFWFVDDLHKQAALVSGRWPSESSAREGAAVEVALSAAAARALPAAPGDRFTVTSATFAAPVEVVVTGVYAARDPAGPVADLDPTAGAGIVEGEFTTVGPLAVPREVFVERFAPSARLSWSVRPSLAGLDPAGVLRLRDGLAALRSQINSAPIFAGAVSVTTELDDLLGQAQRSLVVSRSTLPVPLVLLGILAACALAYVGALVHGRRRDERELLQARGASGAQLGGAALLEGLALAAPAVLVAPSLAAVLLRWGAGPPGLGPGSAAGAVPLVSTPSIWVAMAVVAVAGVLALTAPELAAAARHHRVRWRARIRPGAQRAGGDIALLLLAFAAFLQLRAAGSPFTSVGPHSVRADPVYVVAPVMLLVAVTLLGLRLLPFPARWAALRAAAGGAAVPALGTWPVSRRPRRYAMPVLLLVLAVSIGLLSTVAGASGARSRADQANHQVGSDVRVVLPPAASPATALRDAPGTGAAGLAPPAALLAVPGVEEAMAAARDQVDAGAGPDVGLLAVDSARADEVVLLRPDLLDRPVHDAFAALRGPAVESFVPLPAGAARITGRAGVAITQGPDGRTDAVTPVSLTVLVRDQRGLLTLVPWGEVVADGSARPMAATLPSGSDAVLGVLLTYSVDPLGAPHGDGSAAVALTDVRVDGHLLDLSGTAWSTAVGGDGTHGSAGPLGKRWAAATSAGAGSLAFATPIDRPFARVITLAGTPEQLGRVTPLTAVASQAFLRAHQRHVGDEVGIRVRGIASTVRVVAAAADVPTVTGQQALVVDLPTLQRMLLRGAGRSIAPGEWWLDTEPGHERSVAAAIRDEGAATATVLDRVSARAALDDDPLGLAFQGALRIALLGGLAFTLVGFAVHALVSVDERRAELALLRALGMRARHVSAALLVEQALVLGLGLLLGVLAGLVVSRLVVPLTTVSARTGAVVPPGVLVVPWVQIGALVLGLFVVLLGALGVGSRALGRDRSGAVGRTGQLS